MIEGEISNQFVLSKGTKICNYRLAYYARDCIVLSFISKDD